MTRTRCDFCGVDGFTPIELIPGWYVRGVFTPMAGGRFVHCADCTPGLSKRSIVPYEMPVLSLAVSAIAKWQRRRLREVHAEE
jgi:hypothetical protein